MVVVVILQFERGVNKPIILGCQSTSFNVIMFQIYLMHLSPVKDG